MTKAQNRHWQKIGIGVLAAVMGAFFMWYGIERFDHALVKYRQVGRIAGAGFVFLVGIWMIVHQVRSGSKST